MTDPKHRGLPPCPSLSPETDTACLLTDIYEAHAAAGGVHWNDDPLNGSTRAWRLDDADYARWEMSNPRYVAAALRSWWVAK